MSVFKQKLLCPHPREIINPTVYEDKSLDREGVLGTYALFCQLQATVYIIIGSYNRLLLEGFSACLIQIFIILKCIRTSNTN
jgi:hypothetical protein